MKGKTIIKIQENLNGKLKGMGVSSFIGVLEPHILEGFKWDYVHYKNETNNCRILIICVGFGIIYKYWKIKDSKINIEAPTNYFTLKYNRYDER